MDQTVNTGGSSWADWFQGVAGGVIGKAADAAYVKPYDIKALELQALGSGGYYTEGKPGATQQGQGFTLTPGVMLLAGAALVAVLMLRD